MKRFLQFSIPLACPTLFINVLLPDRIDFVVCVPQIEMLHHLATSDIYHLFNISNEDYGMYFHHQRRFITEKVPSGQTFFEIDSGN